MSSRTSATRYAKALLDVTPSDADAGKIERDLTTFVDLLHDEQRAAPGAARAVGAGQRQARHRDRGRRTHRHGTDRRPAAAAARRPRSPRHDGRPARRVSRASARSPEDRARRTPFGRGADARRRSRPSRLQLGAVTGMNVAVDAVVDPDLIGGVLAKVGSTVYDGTVKSQLDRLRKQLVGQA